MTGHSSLPTSPADDNGWQIVVWKGCQYQTVNIVVAHFCYVRGVGATKNILFPSTTCAPFKLKTNPKTAGTFKSYIGTMSILFRPHVHVDVVW